MVEEIGRLTMDINVKSVNDKKVLNNRIAIKRSKEQTTFVDIVAWNGTAELIQKYYKKGYEILIQGELINSTYKKENVEFQKVVILVEKVIFTNGNPKEFTGNLDSNIS